MNRRTRFVTIVINVLVILALSQVGAQAGSPLGSGFTYQGLLTDAGGSPLSKTCDFQFALFTDGTAGSQLGATITQSGVSVVKGVFSVTLNSGGEFGPSAFTGEARWLAVSVKCSGDTAYTPLLPRQALNPAPYALSLPSGAILSGTGGASGIGLTSVNTAISGTTYGLEGITYSPSGTGVAGYALSVSGQTTGVSGQCASTSCNGVWGYATSISGSTTGVLGSTDSTGGSGVVGVLNATSGTGVGVLGISNSPNGYGVISNGNLAVMNGNTTTYINTASAGKQPVYAEQSTNVWVEAIGSGQLSNGKAIVTIDPIYIQMVSLVIDSNLAYYVFITPLDDCPLFLEQRTVTQFQVWAMSSGCTMMNSSFEYRIIARRKGYEHTGQAPAPSAAGAQQP